MTAQNIFFIRHGESMGNAGFVTTSTENNPLSSKGITQAQNLAQNITCTPELIATSLFIRTQQTAAPLISKLPDVTVETWDMIHEFTYLNRILHSGKTPEERKPYAIAYWNKRDPFHCDDPHEESFYMFLKRAETFLEKINQRSEKTIYVFSHEQFLNALKIVKSLKNPIDKLSKEELSNCMDTIVILQKTKPIPHATPLTWDEISL